MASKKGIRTLGIAEQQGSLLRSWHILNEAHASARAFLDLFDKSKAGKAGTTTDEQQDLLRAMVVFASAGLDSMIKQLLRDRLTDAVGANETAKGQLENWIRRRVASSRAAIEAGEAPTKGNVPDLLVRLLISNNSLEIAIEEFTEALCLESFQSLEQLHKAVAALGLTVPTLTLGDRSKNLRLAFTARNQIVHEMDIDFDNKNRRRKSRTRPDMVDMANLFLETAEHVLQAAIGLSTP